MQYFGGKARISGQLSKFLNDYLEADQPFIDMFCGSCNVICKINKDRQRIANDKHQYLISMWESVSNGWLPEHKITKDYYIRIRSNKDENKALTGFVGFGMSFGGKWFGGFTGEISKNGQDYFNCAVNGIKRKAKGLDGVQF